LITESRRQRKKNATKELIYTSALELFLEKGYDQTTIEEITQKADVAKGTFFNHFPSKNAILFYIGEKRLVLLDRALEDELLGIQSAKEKLFEYFRILARFNEEEKEITHLIIMEIFKNADLLKISEDKSIVNFQVVLSKIINEGKQREEFRSDVDTTYVADILAGVYFYTLFSWLQGKLSKSLTFELLGRMEVILDGVSLGQRDRAGTSSCSRLLR